MEALRTNNSPAPNTGIYTAYRFSSPANHANTGPYGNFLQIAKHPDFAPLLRETGRLWDPSGWMAIMRVKLYACARLPEFQWNTNLRSHGSPAALARTAGWSMEWS